MPLSECKEAFGLGLGAHLIFDIITYALAITFGIRIGCRKHKHG